MSSTGQQTWVWWVVVALLLSCALAACNRAQSSGDLPPRLRSAEAKARGRELFQTYCALCHGERADGHGVRQQALSGPPQDFTKVDWRWRVTPGEVFALIRDGKPGTSMPAWRQLGEDSIWDLTAYLLSVSEEGP